jgi:hypothetical protein
MRRDCTLNRTGRGAPSIPRAIWSRTAPSAGPPRQARSPTAGVRRRAFGGGRSSRRGPHDSSLPRLGISRETPVFLPYCSDRPLPLDNPTPEDFTCRDLLLLIIARRRSRGDCPVLIPRAPDPAWSTMREVDLPERIRIDAPVGWRGSLRRRERCVRLELIFNLVLAADVTTGAQGPDALQRSARSVLGCAGAQ